MQRLLIATLLAASAAPAAADSVWGDDAKGEIKRVPTSQWGDDDLDSRNIKPRPDKGPSAKLGTVKVKGGLDKAVVTKFLRRSMIKVHVCHDAKPNAKGTITAKLTIGTDGSVTSTTASGVDAELSKCIAGVFEKTLFPKPRGGQVAVTAPIVLKRARS